MNQALNLLLLIGFLVVLFFGWQWVKEQPAFNGWFKDVNTSEDCSEFRHDFDSDDPLEPVNYVDRFEQIKEGCL